MSNVPITEMTDLDADELHLVKTGANGFPALLAKSVADEIEVAKGEVEEDAAEDDDGDEPDNDDLATGGARKAKLKARERNALPKEEFALPDSRDYPIPDESHARNALARASGKPEEKRVRAAVRRKFPNIGDDEAKKSPGVPEESVATPTAAGHTPDTGQSGQDVRPMTREVPLSDIADELNGRDIQTAEVPVMADRITHPPKDESLDQALGKAASEAYAGLAAAMEDITAQRTAATKDGATQPGSPAWESIDSATLTSVAQRLAACTKDLGLMQQREAIEAAAGDGGDIQDTIDLGDASGALDYALGIVARLAFHEGVAAKSGDAVIKVGRRLSARTTTALRAARDHLTDVLGDSPHNAGDAGPASEEEEIMTTLTKEELAEVVGQASAAAATAAVERLTKNANNGGDITEETLRSGIVGESASNDVETVGGKVDSQYVNKGTETDEAAALRKEVDELKETVRKMAQRPRAGGPVLDGIARGAAAASEGRHGENVAKSAEDGEIEHLEKAFAEAKDPYSREAIGERLSYARLVRAHTTGQLPAPTPPTQSA